MDMDGLWGPRMAVLLVILTQLAPGVPDRVRPHSGTPPARLWLRGGGGVFDGQFSEAHGLGRVSESLLLRERLGASCGDPPNVPPDITSNHHLDSLAPQRLFQSIGTADALGTDRDALLTPDWEEQGRNFVKAHVARGAAMIADMGGASLHLARALHAKFDADGDGCMQREDLEALLAATEPRAYQADNEEKVTPDVWRQILNDTGSDPAEGLRVDGLLWLYSQPGEDVRKDCWTVFGTEGMANIPFYNPLYDIFPDPAMFRAAMPAGQAAQAGSEADVVPPQGPGAPAGDGPSGDALGDRLKLRRWILEDSTLPPDHDVWDDRSLEEVAPTPPPSRPQQCWHEQDWSAVDIRLLRDFLLETSLRADCKQRPMQTVAADPPIMSTPGTLLNRPQGPVEAYGLTWDE
jgi:hypothetical protein